MTEAQRYNVIAAVKQKLKCPVCAKLMTIRRKDLWYPDQSGARAKCSECGEWSTMAELGICK